MRFVLLCAAALAAAPAVAQDLVVRQGNDTIRLADAPCTSEQVLARLQPAIQAEFKAALAVVEGRTFEACWRPAGEVVHLLYEDGDQGVVPLADLKPELKA
ncbi:MAG TPA: hypothetical protein VKP68_10785 [Ramlibacter sp.]|nr:hypothetical protein [Ramlibacter sp.]